MDGVPYNFICFNIEGLIYTTTSTISKLFQNFIPVKNEAKKKESDHIQQQFSQKLLPENLTQFRARTTNSPFHYFEV